MASFSEDGNGPWFVVTSEFGIHVAFEGDFGGGTITFETQVGTSTKELTDHDNSDTAFSYTAEFDDYFRLQKGTYVRPVLVGSTGPAIQYEMNGCHER